MPKSVFTDAYRSLIDILITARTEAGVTQAELSRRLGKPQPFISKIETGVRRIDVVEFCVIARAIGADPLQLFEKLTIALPRQTTI
ncbi:MAG: helix-turn-helix domain-containing protein [Brevundimonas sp.]